MKSSQSQVLFSAFAISCIATFGCAGAEEDGEAVQEAQEALASTSTADSTGVVAEAAVTCTIKKAGFFKHPTLGGICYYAEATQLCGKTVYAYERDVSTNQLQTGWGALYAYACHPAVVGHQYRGQYAFDTSASSVVTFQGTAAAFAALKPLPRT